MLILMKIFLFIISIVSIEFVSPSSCSKIPVIVFDVDGTLYEDSCNIEQQIRSGCIKYGEGFNYSSSECDELHLTYGSTIRAIIEKVGSNELIADYYSKVYPDLDMSQLMRYSTPSKETAGYRLIEGHNLRKMLSIESSKIVIASNSPKFHVKRVFNRLGISDLKVAAYFTPERMSGVTKSDRRFWLPLLEMFPLDTHEIALIDDNGLNIEIVESLGIRGIRITPSTSLPEALLTYLNVLPVDTDFKNNSIPNRVRSTFSFNESQYLVAKNVVDSFSLNVTVRNQSHHETVGLHRNLALSIVLFILEDLVAPQPCALDPRRSLLGLVLLPGAFFVHRLTTSSSYILYNCISVEYTIQTAWSSLYTRSPVPSAHRVLYYGQLSFVSYSTFCLYLPAYSHGVSLFRLHVCKPWCLVPLRSYRC